MMILRQFTDLSTFLESPATQAAIAAVRTDVQYSKQTSDGQLSQVEFAMMMNRTMFKLWPEVISNVDDHTIIALIDFTFQRINGSSGEAGVARFDELFKSMAVALVAEGISDAVCLAEHDSAWGKDVNAAIIAHESWREAFAVVKAEQKQKYLKKPAVLVYLKQVFDELEARIAREEAIERRMKQEAERARARAKERAAVEMLSLMTVHACVDAAYRTCFKKEEDARRAAEAVARKAARMVGRRKLTLA